MAKPSIVTKILQLSMNLFGVLVLLIGLAWAPTIYLFLRDLLGVHFRWFTCVLAVAPAILILAGGLFCFTVARILKLKEALRLQRD